MNLIKYVDELTDDQTFNQYFKGRYCTAVRMLTCFPIDTTGKLGLNIDLYKQYEINYDTLLGTTTYPHILLADFEDQVDITITSQFYNINAYEYLNDNTSDADLTFNMVANFRTHLASIIHKYTHLDDEQFNTMINYYRMGMTDCAVSNMKLYKITPPKTVTWQMNSTLSCSCNNTPQSSCVRNPKIKFQEALTPCDPIITYMTEIRTYMQYKFSDYTFWTTLDKIILLEIIKYLKNIYKLGLSVYSNAVIDTQTDCRLASQTSQLLTKYKEDIENITIAFTMIYKNEIDKNKLFISSQMEIFSQYYEAMQWVPPIIEPDVHE